MIEYGNERYAPTETHSARCQNYIHKVKNKDQSNQSINDVERGTDVARSRPLARRRRQSAETRRRRRTRSARASGEATGNDRDGRSVSVVASREMSTREKEETMTTTCARDAREDSARDDGEATRGRPRLAIEKMVLENFKSYAGAQHVGPFHKVRRDAFDARCESMRGARRDDERGERLTATRARATTTTIVFFVGRGTERKR